MTSDLYQAFAEILPESALKTSPADLNYYGKDWTKVLQPAPSLVVLPGSTEDVQAIVRLAQKLKVALVPSGGRTGLSGGAMAANGEVVIAMDRMNKILDYNSVDRQVRCQAGVLTQELQNFANDKGLLYPVDFASSGSSQIAGNIATNAGGIQVIRYGMTRQWVMGLQVVLADGSLIDTNKGLYKNATGYDLRHLLIGSEGTLGIIVEAQLQLTTKPAAPRVLVLGLADMAAVMSVLQTFLSEFQLNAYEFFSKNALDYLRKHRAIQAPFDTDANYYVLLEIEQNAAASTDQFDEKLMNAFESVVESGWVEDGVISQSLQQAQDLWVLREGISESLAPHTPYKNDISVLPSKVPQMLEAVESLVNTAYPGWEIVWFGHIGDGNLHLNIMKPKTLSADEFFTQCHQVTHQVSQVVQDLNGSISAEHGVGVLKRDYLHYARSPIEIEIMRGIKKVFDPNDILNPGKIFTEQ